MAVSAPPRPPDHDELQHLADELRALIEEARRRARRRRLLYAVLVAAAAAAAAFALTGRGGGARPSLGDASADAAAPPATHARWTAGRGLDGGMIYSGAVDPAQRGVAYLGTASTGVFKTTDGGRHWHAANSGISALRTDAIAVDPTRTSTLYAGTGDGVFKSTDGGRTWRRSARGLELGHDRAGHRAVEGYVYALAVDAAHSSTVYAGTAWGAYRSDDAGSTWRQLAHIRDWALVGEIRVEHGTVYVVARDRLLKSTDRGRHWRRLRTPWPPEHLAVGDRLWLSTERGVYASRDGGASWTRAHGAPRAFGALAVDGSSVYLTAGRSIYATSDGTTWHAVHRGSDWIITLLADHGTVLAAGTGGVLRSVDSGASWRPAMQGLAAASVSALAGGRGPLLAAAGTLFRSTDGGRTWRPLVELLGVTTVAIANGTYFAGTSTRGLLATTYPATSSWTRTALPATWVLSLATDGDVVYAGTGRGLLVSADRGAHWHATPIAWRVWALTVAEGAVYAGTVSGGVWRSEDAGATWERTTPHGSVVRSLAVDGDTVYAAAAKGLFVSPDRGATWQPLPAKPRAVRALAVDPSDGTLYAGTDFDGVYASGDGGASWRRLGPRVGVEALLFDAPSSTLVAGTRGRGVLLLRGR